LEEGGNKRRLLQPKKAFAIQVYKLANEQEFPVREYPGEIILMQFRQDGPCLEAFCKTGIPSFAGRSV
jgi:hypothetical protein